MLYLLMIPAFSLVYTASAGSFYQTSATHEPSYITNEFNVAQAVAQGAYRNAQFESTVNNCKNCASVEPPLGSSVTANATDLFVSIRFIDASATGDIIVQVDIPENTIPNPGVVIEGNIFLPYSLISAPSGAANGSGALSLQLFEQYTNSAASPDMPVTMVELNSIQQLADAAQGMVSGLPDQFSRMLYLSAVSATTLGFGDIVPVTTGSRSLVTLEAILGVVFAGLFLNSLAKRRSSETTNADSTLPTSQSDNGATS